MTFQPGLGSQLQIVVEDTFSAIRFTTSWYFLVFFYELDTTRRKVQNVQRWFFGLGT
jgi:hypothetical protein